MDALTHAGFLAHATLSAYQRRVEQARKWIREALALCERPYIAFSTGKDSTVMADMIWRERPRAPAVYFDADACFPESAEMLNRYQKHKEVIIWITEPILDTMEKVGGPTSIKSSAATMRSTVYEPIKNLLMEHDFDCSFVGLRAEENRDRKKAFEIKGSLFFSKRDGIYICWPIGRLTFKDVWAYILSNGVDYCTVYDKQFEMGLDWEDCRLSYCYGETKHTHGRWAILARGWPNIFNKFSQRFPEVRRFI